MSIGSKDGAAVDEAQRRIELILDPPTAEVGAVYKGRVVNITKFGAFVNILPGRDGLIHISKLGRGKRIDRVEDVLALGDELAVKVDDIDQNGKLSLSLLGDDGDDSGGDNGGGNASGPRDRDRESRAPRGDRPARESSSRDSGRDSGESRRVVVTASGDGVVRVGVGRAGPRGVRRPRAAAEPEKSGAGGDRGRGGRGGRGGGGGARRGGPRR